jgi:protein SCO1/2
VKARHRWPGWLPCLLLALCACGEGAEKPTMPGHEMHAGDEAHAADLTPAPVGPDSLFQLESEWTTPDGRQIPLSELSGRVQVLAMVYTHCEHACPRIIADMRSLRSELGDTGNEVGYVLVSLDPERDDAERLAEFAAETGLAEGWSLLRSDEGSVRELAAALGIRYRRISETDFLHSNLLSVLDPTGVVIHQQIGLGVDPVESAAVIRALLAAPTR